MGVVLAMLVGSLTAFEGEEGGVGGEDGVKGAGGGGGVGGGNFRIL